MKQAWAAECVEKSLQFKLSPEQSQTAAGGSVGGGGGGRVGGAEVFVGGGGASVFVGNGGLVEVAEGRVLVGGGSVGAVVLVGIIVGVLVSLSVAVGRAVLVGLTVAVLVGTGVSVGSFVSVGSGVSVNASVGSGSVEVAAGRSWVDSGVGSISEAHATRISSTAVKKIFSFISSFSPKTSLVPFVPFFLILQ